MAAPLPSQETPLIFHPLPYRPYNPVLKSAWNDADQHCTQIQLPTTGAANAYTTSCTSPQIPDKSEAIQMRFSISTPPISVQTQNIACQQFQALPFLTNWRSMAGIATVPKHHPGLQMTRASKPIDTYIYALVDGNRLLPHINLIRGRYPGGHGFARRLHLSIIRYLNVKLSTLDQGLEIVTHVYYDKQTLMQAYGFAKGSSTHQEFKDFCRGFRAYHEHTAYEDVGQDEAHHLGENLLRAARDPRCQQIVFARPTFDAYVNLVKRLAKDHLGDSIWNKINPSFDAEELFDQERSQPLRRIPTPFIGLEVPRLSRYIQEPSPVLEWRQSHKVEAASPSPPGPEGFAKTGPADTYEGEGKIGRNRSGQRVDPPIKYSHKVRESLAGRRPRMCNVHHLRGQCPFGPRCEYNHGPLNDEERCALQRLAREQPCRMGNECKDAACFAGHHCPRNKGCSDTCRFSLKMHVQGKDMHVRDLRIVNVDSDHLGCTSTFITNTGGELCKDNGEQRADAQTAAA